MEIEKTNRMNALFEFYAALLTDKQMNYIELYLEDYEMKLHMYSDYIVRSQIFDQILEQYPNDDFLQEQIEILTSIDNRE